MFLSDAQNEGQVLDKIRKKGGEEMDTEETKKALLNPRGGLLKSRTNVMKKKILIIDDDKNLTQLVKVHLEISDEYQVLIENRGRHGLYTARMFKPDLILLDILMPQMDGLKVLKALKKDSQTMSIPVIMLTAVDDEHAKIKAMEQYSEYYITKSLITKELKTRVDEILKGH